VPLRVVQAPVLVDEQEAPVADGSLELQADLVERLQGQALDGGDRDPGDGGDAQRLGDVGRT
jgi:hypothetical protein